MNPQPIASSKEIEKVRSGQRLILLAILLNLGSIPFRIGTQNEILAVLSALLMLVALGFSIVGILRLTAGLGYQIALRILCCIVMIFPMINLLVLLLLNIKATNLLREHGFKVGLLGAKKLNE